MKKSLLFLGSVITGIFTSFIVHGVVEMIVIELLLYDFEKYGLGLSWDVWFSIHKVGAVVLFVSGVVGGYLWGRKIIENSATE